MCIVILCRHERDIESFKALVEEARDFDLGNIEEIVNKKKNEFWKNIIWQHDYRFFRGNVVILIYCSFVGLQGGWVGPNDDLYLEEKLKKSRSGEEELSLVGDYII